VIDSKTARKKEGKKREGKRRDGVVEHSYCYRETLKKRRDSIYIIYSLRIVIIIYLPYIHIHKRIDNNEAPVFFLLLPQE